MRKRHQEEVQISSLNNCKNELAIHWDKKKKKVGEADCNGTGERLELSFKYVKCETHVIYQNGQLNRHLDIWNWRSGKKSRLETQIWVCHYIDGI